MSIETPSLIDPVKKPNPAPTTPAKNAPDSLQAAYTRLLYICLAAYTVFVLFNLSLDSTTAIVCGIAIAVCSFLPAYLWSIGKLPGLPIYPAMALTYSWTYALPLFNRHKALESYTPQNYVEVTATTILFLIAGALAYAYVLHLPYAKPRIFLAIPESNKVWTYNACLFACGACLGTLSSQAFSIPGDIASIATAVALTLSTVCVFVVGHRWGQNRLTSWEIAWFILAMGWFLVVNTASLLLVSGMTICLVGVSGFALGRGKVPFYTCTGVFLLFGFLHLGKGEVRNEYWHVRTDPIGFADYPELFQNWFEFSINEATASLRPDFEEKDEGQNLSQRASLVQMLLLVQSLTPDTVPYLNGKTYEVIPGMMLPRFLNKDKMRTHEGTYILAIDYGIQTREATFATTIGFGCLAEAYANFGYPGVILIASVFGAVFGFGARISQGVPLTSMRGLVAIVLQFSAIQSEYTAGVLVTSLFQSLIVILFVAIFAMRPESAASAHDVF